MKNTLISALAWVLLAGAAVILPLTSAHALEVFSAESETRIYDSTQSYNGYFIPSNMGGTVYLLDMMGYIVHTWPLVNGWSPRLMEDGTMWAGGYIYDWDGNLIWSFTTAPYMAHHDYQKIWNKKLNQWTMLINCNRTITQAEAVAMGMDPGVTYGNRLAGHDFVAEVNMAKQIVWEWYPFNHGCQSKNPAWPNYVSDVKNAPGRLDVNWLTNNSQPAITGTAGTVSDWFHVNSIDYNDDTGQVVINQKHWSQFIVIDHDKTFVSATDFAANAAAAAGPDGDLIYRFGAPASYNAGTSPGFMTEGDNQMYGSHNIQYIRPYHWKRPMLATDKWPDPATLYGTQSVANPGAGNFLIFDNGCYNPTGMRSRVLEINGYLNSAGTNTGKFVDPVVAGYQTPAGVYHKSKQLVWSYASKTQHSFYSSHISGCQRLPNGNTNVDAGNQGHFFEVTPGGTVVWEYEYPGVVGSSITIEKDGSTGSCYRCWRYGTNFPGLTGKDLTPTQTITGKIPALVGTHGVNMYVAPTYTGFGYAPGGSSGGGGGAAGGSGGGGGGY